MTIAKKIKSIEAEGYKFEKVDNENYLFVVITPTGESKRTITAIDYPMLFGKNRIPLTNREIIKYLFNPTDDELCYFEHGFSLKTLEYLNTQKSNIGYVESGYNEDYEKVLNYAKENHLYCYTGNSSEVWSGVYHLFTHEPTAEEIKIMKFILSLEEKFHKDNIPDKKVICGKTIHWTDFDGNIFEKWNEYGKLKFINHT